MKCLLTLVAMLFFCAALADARVEIGPNGYDNKGENMIHFPWDSNNTDNEFYSSTGEITFLQYNGGNRGHVRAEHSVLIPRDMLPPDLKYALERMRVVEVSHLTTGETCTIEANGTTFVSDAWVVKLTKSGITGALFPVDMTISCYAGAAQ